MEPQEYLADPRVRPYESFGPCPVVSCDRARNSQGPYCPGHDRALARLRLKQKVDEAAWQRTAPAIVEGGKVSLRGLSDRVVAEAIYGLQERTKAGARIRDYILRPLCDTARKEGLTTLEDLDPAPLSKLARGFLGKILRASNLLRLTPETERHKDVWDLAAFGPRGTLRFTGMSESWLRQAAQHWCYDELPRRRGDKVGRIFADHISQLERLSDSLRLQRPDEGADVTVLDRQDITSFCNRLAYLTEHGRLTAYGPIATCRNVRRMLTRMRTLGLTPPRPPLQKLH